MLKVHPEYKIYGIDYINTLKSLIKEEFVEEVDIPGLNFISLVRADGSVDVSASGYKIGTPLYEIETQKGVQYLPFPDVYAIYLRQAPCFLVTVCEQVGDKLVPIGFIYS